jgi:hypothetical protein
VKVGSGVSVGILATVWSVPLAMCSEFRWNNRDFGCQLLISFFFQIAAEINKIGRKKEKTIEQIFCFIFHTLSIYNEN